MRGGVIRSRSGGGLMNCETIRGRAVGGINWNSVESVCCIFFCLGSLCLWEEGGITLVLSGGLPVGSWVGCIALAGRSICIDFALGGRGGGRYPHSSNLVFCRRSKIPE